MVGNCIIEVDETYLSTLISVIELCHQNMAESYRKFLITGFSCCDTCETSLSNLICLSDIIFFLNLVDLDNDDCKYVHLAKEKAMHLCTFNESNLSNGAFNDALLLEDGLLILLENGVNYIELETNT